MASKYGSYSVEASAEDGALVASISAGGRIKLQDGDNFVRILPPKLGKKTPFRVTEQHYIKIGSGTDAKTIVFACHKTERVGECPGCKLEAEFKAQGLTKEARDASANICIMALAINRMAPAGAQVLEVKKQVYLDLQAIRQRPRGGGDFTNPGPDGFDIIINKSGSGQQTKYSASPDRGSCPACESDAELDEIMDSAPNLDDYVKTEIPEEFWAAYPHLKPGRPAPRGGHAGQLNRQAVGQGLVRKPMSSQSEQFEPGAPDGEDAPF